MILESAGPDDTISIGASVLASENTRGSYIESGPVVEGTYLLHYRPTSYTSTTYYKNAFVDFGASEGPQIGFAYFMNGDQRKDLKWRHTYNEGSSSLTFMLSNLDPATYSESNSSSYKHLRFNQAPGGVSNNPYVASPLDEVDGKNDLLIGSASAKSADGRINFTLSHILSLLKINIEVYAAESDNWSVNLDNARMFISNLCTTTGAVEMYSSYRSTFYYSTTAATSYSTYGGTYRDVKNVDMRESSGEARNWDKVEKNIQVDGYEEEYHKAVYESKKFVFPPQSIPPTNTSGTIPSISGYGRPVLTVRVPKYDAVGIESEPGDSIDFIGNIPTIMFNADEDGNIIESSPQNIALRSGYQLTITATINSPETVLTFAPVKIERWVSKSTFSIKTKQGGIYSTTDFYDMIDAYNAGDIDRMERYGYRDSEGNFVFQFWASIKLNKDQISGMMVPNGTTKPEFSFLLNGYTATIQESGKEDDELAEIPGQFQLYNIVTGKNTQFNGIQTVSDMRAVINEFNSSNPRITEILKYGSVNNSDNTVIFNINGSFDIALEEIFQKVDPSKLWGYDIFWNITNGNHVKVKIPDAPELDINLDAGDNHGLLTRLMVTKAYGIYNSDDFYLLLDGYNKYYRYFPEFLSLFGIQNTPNNWTFYYKAAMNVDGNKAYVSMVPDPDNYKPNYSVSGSYNITFVHPKVQCVISGGSTYNALSGKGYSSAQTGLSTIKNNYTNNTYSTLWNYGYYDMSADKWVFSLRYSTSSTTYQYSPYSTIFNGMVPDYENGKYDYEFQLVYPARVTSVPSSITDVGTTPGTTMYFFQDGNDSYNYPNTAEDLKRIANGTYWEYYKEWKEKQSVRAKRSKASKRK